MVWLMEKLRIRIIRSYYKDANLFWTVITPRHLKLIGSIKDTGEEKRLFHGNNISKYLPDF
jgi:hypothetical protein